MREDERTGPGSDRVEREGLGAHSTIGAKSSVSGAYCNGRWDTAAFSQEDL